MADGDGIVYAGTAALVELVPLSDDVRALAVSAQPPQLRTLDAVHLASALTLGEDLELVVTYDDRLQSAAASSGAQTVRPA